MAYGVADERWTYRVRLLNHGPERFLGSYRPGRGEVVPECLAYCYDTEDEAVRQAWQAGFSAPDIAVEHLQDGTWVPCDPEAWDRPDVDLCDVMTIHGVSPERVLELRRGEGGYALSARTRRCSNCGQPLTDGERESCCAEDAEVERMERAVEDGQALSARMRTIIRSDPYDSNSATYDEK